MQKDLFGHTEEKKAPEKRTVRDLTREKRDSVKSQAEEEKLELDKEKPAILARLLSGQNYYPDPEDLQSAWIAGRGGKGTKNNEGKKVIVALVALYPGKAEIRHKPQPRVLVGKSGQFLENTLEYCTGKKHRANEVYLTNLIKYFKDEKSKLTTVEKQFGLEILIEELKHVGADYVICLGSEVYNTLVRNASTYSASKFRGVFLDTKHCRADIPTAGLHNPAHVIRPEGISEKKSFQEDLVALFKHIKEGHTQQQDVEYDTIKTLQDVNKWVQSIKEYSEKTRAAGKKVILGLDTETEVEKIDGNLYPSGVFIVSTTFSHTEAKDESELHNQIWALRMTPQWTELRQSDINMQEGLGLEEFTEEGEEESDYEEPTNYFIIDPSDPEQAEKTQIQIERWLKKSEKNVAKVLNTSEIRETKLNTKNGRFRVRMAIENAVKKYVDEFVMMNGSFDKSATETTFNINWDCLLEGGINREKELMMSCHLLDENYPKGLKHQAAKQLGWRHYDLPLEIAKAEYGISNYLHFPFSICAPYAALDSAATVLCENRNRDLSDRKWFTRKNLIEEYYKNIQVITPTPLSDITEQNTMSLRKKMNDLMPVLFRLKNKGMPVGKDGRKKAAQLTEFYYRHYTSMALEVNQKLSEVSPKISEMDPSSNEQVAAILYSAKTKGGLGLTPFKSAGKDGRIWNRLSPQEKRTATGATDAESMNSVLYGLEQQLPKDVQKALKNSNLPNEREAIYKDCPEAKTYGFVRRLFECRRIQNLYNNFATDSEDSGFFARIGKDDRLHTDYMPVLETLRFRSKPNLANPPKMESKWAYPLVGEMPPCDIRNIVRAGPGHKLLTRDWATAEVYMLMYRSGDPNGLAVIEKGLDFHLLVGLNTNKLLQNAKLKWETKDKSLLKEMHDAMTFGKEGKDLKNAQKILDGYITKLFYSNEEKDMFSMLKTVYKSIRDSIKPTTFGVPYGETAEGLARQSGKTPEEAQMDIDGYKETYKQAIAYLDYQAEFSRTHGFLPTPCGYIRNFPYGMNKGDMERQSYNLQIQHGVGVMMIDAMLDWEKKRQKYNLKSELFMTLYDALGWDVPDNEIPTVAEISHDIMTTERPVGPLDSRTIPTEGEFIECWEGEPIKELKFPEFNL